MLTNASQPLYLFLSHTYSKFFLILRPPTHTHSHKHTQIWVCSPHNGSGYYGLREEINDALSLEHFKATLSGTSDKYARTGYLGFMMKSGKIDRSGGMLANLNIDEYRTV